MTSGQPIFSLGRKRRRIRDKFYVDGLSPEKVVVINQGQMQCLEMYLDAKTK